MGFCVPVRAAWEPLCTPCARAKQQHCLPLRASVSSAQEGKNGVSEPKRFGWLTRETIRLRLYQKRSTEYMLR